MRRVPQTNVAGLCGHAADPLTQLIMVYQVACACDLAEDGVVGGSRALQKHWSFQLQRTAHC